MSVSDTDSLKAMLQSVVDSSVNQLKVLMSEQSAEHHKKLEILQSELQSVVAKVSDLEDRIKDKPLESKKITMEEAESDSKNAGNSDSQYEENNSAAFSDAQDEVDNISSISIGDMSTVPVESSEILPPEENRSLLGLRPLVKKWADYESDEEDLPQKFIPTKEEMSSKNRHERFKIQQGKKSDVPLELQAKTIPTLSTASHASIMKFAQDLVNYRNVGGQMELTVMYSASLRTQLFTLLRMTFRESVADTIISYQQIGDSRIPPLRNDPSQGRWELDQYFVDTMVQKYFVTPHLSPSEAFSGVELSFNPKDGKVLAESLVENFILTVEEIMARNSVEGLEETVVKQITLRIDVGKWREVAQNNKFKTTASLFDFLRDLARKSDETKKINYYNTKTDYASKVAGTNKNGASNKKPSDHTNKPKSETQEKTCYTCAGVFQHEISRGKCPVMNYCESADTRKEKFGCPFCGVLKDHTGKDCKHENREKKIVHSAYRERIVKAKALISKQPTSTSSIKAIGGQPTPGRPRLSLLDENPDDSRLPKPVSIAKALQELEDERKANPTAMTKMTKPTHQQHDQQDQKVTVSSFLAQGDIGYRTNHARKMTTNLKVTMRADSGADSSCMSYKFATETLGLKEDMISRADKAFTQADGKTPFPVKGMFNFFIKNITSKHLFVKDMNTLEKRYTNLCETTTLVKVYLCDMEGEEVMLLSDNDIARLHLFGHMDKIGNYLLEKNLILNQLCETESQIQAIRALEADPSWNDASYEDSSVAERIKKNVVNLRDSCKTWRTTLDLIDHEDIMTEIGKVLDLAEEPEVIVLNENGQHIPNEQITDAPSQVKRIRYSHRLSNLGILVNGVKRLRNRCSLSEEMMTLIGLVHREGLMHAGRNRTYSTIREKYPDFPVTKKMVDEFIDYCPTCQKLDARPTESWPHTTRMSGELGSAFMCDYIIVKQSDKPRKKGKQPTQNDQSDEEDPMRAVLVVQEMMSRWVELIPVRNMSSKELLRGLLLCFGRLGLPKHVKMLSDNGSNLTSKNTKDFFKAVNMMHVPGIAYSHQDQGQVERSHRETTRHISALIHDNPEMLRYWSLYLPLVQRVINSLPNETTGVAPAKLIMPGLDLQAGALGLEFKKIDSPTVEYVNDLYSVYYKLLEQALQHQEKVISKRMKDKDRPTSSFEAAELVLIAVPEKGKSKQHKFGTRMIGPFEVVQQDGASVTVKALLQPKQYKVHLSRVKRFYYDDRYTNPQQIALADHDADDLYIVEDIRDHKGSNKASMQFLVKWLGFPESDNTWEPYNNIKELTVLQQYIEDNDLKFLQEGQRRSLKINLVNFEPSSFDASPEPGSVRLWSFAEQPLYDEVEDIQSFDIIAATHMVEPQVCNSDSEISKVKVGGTEEQKAVLLELLQSYSDVFRKIDKQPAKFPPLQLRVKNPEQKPIWIPKRKIPQSHEVVLMEQLKTFLEAGIIEKADANNSWNSPIHMVAEGEDDAGQKKIRMTIDYSAINKIFTESSASMPRIENLIQDTAGCSCLGKLDFQKFFFQLELDEGSRKYTAFEAPDGSRYVFRRLPMGLSKSPEYAQACTSTFFPNRGYMDDVLLRGLSFIEFVEDCKEKFQICRDNNLRISAEKTFLNFEELDYIGYSTDANGFRLQDSMKMNVEEWEPPVFVKNMQSFLGLTNYSRKFIENYSALVQPLYDLTSVNGQIAKGTTKICWSVELINIFNKVKEAVANCSRLHHINYDEEIFVSTDASNSGWGAILWQGDINDKKVVAYLSGSFNDVQRRWPTVEQECFAIYKAVTLWRHFLLGQKFTVYSDHRNLSYILSAETKKLVRWRLAIQEFQFKVIHVSGKANWEADLLSRKLASE